MNDKMIVKNFYERIVSENRLEELSKYVSENCALTLGDKTVPLGLDGMKQHLISVKKTYPDYTMKIVRQFNDKLYPTATDKELAYYVEGNALEPITGDYLYSELVNPVFTADGDNVKVSVAVKFIDNQTKATQVSQYELTLHKDSNWKIIE